MKTNRRIQRERKTVQKMIMMYCRGHHGTKGELCTDCQSLQDYSMQRLEKCPFGAGKPTCAKCPIHCYQKDMREQMQIVMRFAGPRMIWRHPWLALMHLLDGFRKTSD